MGWAALSVWKERKPAWEATMLDRTTYKPTDEAVREGGFYQRLKMLDPVVPGFIFWPIIFGMAVLIGELAVSIR